MMDEIVDLLIALLFKRRWRARRDQALLQVCRVEVRQLRGSALQSAAAVRWSSGRQRQPLEYGRRTLRATAVIPCEVRSRRLV